MIRKCTEKLPPSSSKIIEMMAYMWPFPIEKEKGFVSKSENAFCFRWSRYDHTCGCEVLVCFLLDGASPFIVQIRPRSGYVDIYGSFLNPYPNTAFNEFKTRATSQREAIIYVKDESRPLYLSIVSQGADPVLCKAGSNYDVIVQNKNAIQPGRNTLISIRTK